jgi:hypothetical protein
MVARLCASFTDHVPSFKDRNSTPLTATVARKIDRLSGPSWVCSYTIGARHRCCHGFHNHKLYISMSSTGWIRLVVCYDADRRITRGGEGGGPVEASMLTGRRRMSGQGHDAKREEEDRARGTCCVAYGEPMRPYVSALFLESEGGDP